MSLSTQECKWYWPISEGNLTIAGGHLQWTSIPSKESDNTPRHLMSQKLVLSTCTDEPVDFSDPLGMELTYSQTKWNVPLKITLMNWLFETLTC